ncbi:hypothetical protein NZN88_001022 [Salmonella enterica]|nr:hypothetical protein [Salmonella enterica]
MKLTIENVQLIRSGKSPRGFVGAHTLLSIPNNITSKNADVKYMGARIGHIDNLYHLDMRDGSTKKPTEKTDDRH